MLLPKKNNNQQTLLFNILFIGAVFLFSGCQTIKSSDTRESHTPRFFIEVIGQEATSNKITHIKLPVSESVIPVKPVPTIPEFDIASVSVNKGSLGDYFSFQLHEKARLQLMRICGEYRGRRLVLTLGQKPIGSWRINKILESGTINIYVEIPEITLSSTAAQINQTLQRI